MNQDIKKIWVDELRSGKYKQGRTRLKQGDKFCCLGVLCEIAKEFGLAENESITVLDEAHKKWAGLPSSRGDCVIINGNDNVLTHHNDDGVSFKELADAIDGQL